ncbi:hypothetical protein [Tardiphaga sp. 813_E8_N1_3]|uniref:hypothetical protein n=1 Tax=Tardiphaga sp. 813_E8_N1_3 TaxID=3240760 RepID=UPI003F22626A
MSNSPKDVPSSQAGRIKWVAQKIYPLGRWRIHIARGLCIGRSTLYRYLCEKKPPASSIDDRLMMLMARERIASHRRAREIAKAERVFAQEMGRAITKKDPK